MHDEENYTWAGDVIHQTFTEPHDATLRFDGQSGSLIVSIGHADLPAFVSDGRLYIQAPLPLVFEAFAESLPDFVRDMEIRVSDQRGSTLSLGTDGRPVSGARVAKSSVGRRSRQRR
jgi:hypothetical protein